MIKTSRQLKDLIRNMAKGDSGKSQLLIRNYAMERFLERVALSKYKDNFILKGGMLVSAMAGLDNRSTMDMDATVKNLPLDVETARKVVTEIAAIPLEDNVRFEIRDVSSIMEEAAYGGVRLSLDAFLDTMRIPWKIDISTGDVITPAEIVYHYKLMLEPRTISLWAYPLETVLAEKIETVLARATLNTRLRDYYDIYILQNTGSETDFSTLTAALAATCRKRGSEYVLSEYRRILDQIEADKTMQELWRNFQKKNGYAADIAWETIMLSVRDLCEKCVR